MANKPPKQSEIPNEIKHQPAINSKRVVSKVLNRHELMMGARNAIVECGFANTTISNIIKRTSLSRGMINLHFISKEALILEVVRDFAQEYAEFIEKGFNSYPNDPVKRLKSMISVEFDAEVMNEANARLWFALRSEAHAHPEFLPYVNSRDKKFRQAYYDVFKQLNKLNNSPQLNYHFVGNCFMSIIEGMWSDYLLNHHHFNRQHAIDTCLLMAKAFYPKSFS